MSPLITWRGLRIQIEHRVQRKYRMAIQIKNIRPWTKENYNQATRTFQTIKYTAQRIYVQKNDTSRCQDIRGSQPQKNSSNSAVIAYPRVQPYVSTCDTTKSRFDEWNPIQSTSTSWHIARLNIRNLLLQWCNRNPWEHKIWRHVIQQGKETPSMQFAIHC